MKDQKILWECSSCGHTQPQWTGSCTMCKSWNSFAEQLVYREKNKKYQSKNNIGAKAVRLSEIKVDEYKRIKTNISELDRLLGNGIVSGALILIAGEPGIGKSTLLLQLSHSLTVSGKKVLYISGEESLDQTSLRAKRLNISSENLFLLSETSFSAIKAQIDLIAPDVIIVDSVQIVFKEEIPSSPGSVVQVREIATEFMHIAKGSNITTFLIGHVTKSGEIAGPRVLEHIVDTVLEFEGDSQNGFRLLRSIKNRFGSTDDIAIFQMTPTGLSQIENPSEMFLSQRMKNISGSIVAATVEGVKSILIEIQALVTHSVFPNPSRKSAGLDQNRLALLLAVLEKKIGYKLYTSDVFVSVAGGMKIIEPAIDLAVLLSIASSFSNRPINAETVVMGEVGLSGEIRTISRIESRVKEALNMGFKKCIIPHRNLKDVSKKLQSEIQIVGVNMVNQAIDELI